MSDIGLTHIALPVSDVDRTIEFYSKYAEMQVVHRRIDAEAGVAVVWLSDKRISKVVQASGFIRGINPKSQIENPQAPAFIRGVNLKSKI